MNMKKNKITLTLLGVLFIGLFVTCESKSQPKEPAENPKEEPKHPIEIASDETKDLIDIAWVSIPAGTFMMGSPESEVDRYENENQHLVTLSAFKMSKNEITFAQYDLFCEKTGSEKPSDEGWGRGERPVINVTWDDASAFATWMGCRLPTEAEWEYACRAGSTSAFSTGSNITAKQANCTLEKTMPVGSYPANAWGLHDMHGNVLEWCSDWYGEYSSSAQTNPTGPSSGSDRVLRGGSWRNFALACRSAYRFNYGPSDRNHIMGFRLVVAP